MQSLKELAENESIGLILMNMGGPQTLDDVRPFLYNLFSDPDIINLPWILRPFQKQFAWLVAKFRTPGTSDMYRQIGDGSPILEITKRLGDKIAKNLEEFNISPFVLMRYTPPRAEEIVEELKKNKIDQVVLFSFTKPWRSWIINPNLFLK